MISDTGIGIGSEELNELFAPFAQGREAREQAIHGSGLGLTVVKGLVELHGGQVQLDSTLGHGTTVTVSLPARPDPLDNSGHSDAQA